MKRILAAIFILAMLVSCSSSVTVGDYLITPPGGVLISERISNQPSQEGEICTIPGGKYVEVLETSTVFQGQGVVKISFKSCKGWTLIKNFNAHISGGE